MEKAREETSLIDALQAYLHGMTPAELMAFRRELGRNLPGFLQETADNARRAAQPKPAAVKPANYQSSDRR